MNKELEKKLIDRFPAFFRDMYGDPRHTCMAWGCDTGDGWFQILWDACEKIEKALKPGELFVFDQIKEKFATFRLYYTTTNNTVDVIISEAEALSGKTCELCGKEGSIRGGGWLVTRCDECDKKGK